MNSDQRVATVPPPPTRPPGRRFALLLIPPVAAALGFVPANLSDIPPVLTALGLGVVVAAFGAMLIVGTLTSVKQSMNALAPPATGPYVLVPTTLAWRQLGYPNHASRSRETVNVFITDGLLDLIGTAPNAAIAATVLRSQFVGIRASRVQIEGEPWWGIAIQRVDKPDDLEFGIRDDQRDVAAAEQRAIEVAAQLTRAMRVDGARA